jgi:hypothetical protein
METQVSGFKDIEHEWAIDKVVANSGKRADTIFEILWKSGDITWLPYDQISESGVLKDYFALQGIEHVSELEEGNGNRPTRDPQVSVGHLSLDGSAYKNLSIIPSSPKSSISFTTNDTLLLFSCNLLPMEPLLMHIGTCCFTLPNGVTDWVLMVVVKMVQAYLEHDAHLHSRTATDRATPAEYGDFTLSFNMMQTTNGITSHLIKESSEGPCISGPSPSCTDLIGDEVPAPTQPQPPVPEGGQWINPHHTELLEEALWMNMETTKRQREWCDHSITEHKVAKHACHLSSTPPTNHPLDQGEGSSHSPLMTTPHHQTRMDIDKERMSMPETSNDSNKVGGRDVMRKKK